MPIKFDYGCHERSDRWAEARRQVRAKFPNLREGTSGWNRAIANRFNRIRAA